MAIYTEKELAQALKEEEDVLEIEGDLKKKVLKIKATGKIAWGIAIAAIATAVAATIVAIPTGGTSEVVSFMVAPAAVGILGVDVTMAAIYIAVAAGGVGVLNSLRKYEIMGEFGDTLMLKRKF